MKPILLKRNRDRKNKETKERETKDIYHGFKKNVRLE